MIEDLQLNDIRSLTSSIKNKYSYDFSEYALASFKRRIITILNDNNFEKIDDLIAKIETSETYFNQFLNEVTVNTTEMFRDPDFWSFFRGELKKNFNNKKIKIWHAGCSSGDEVFSMAILLKELGLYDKATILATDISTSIIDKAKKGEYLLSKMETNAKNYTKFEGSSTLDKYYKIENRKAIMDASLLSNVTFKVHNLSNSIEKFDSFDIIICRNVMIYFNTNLQDRVYQLFDNNLKLGGNLIIGIRESMIWSSISNKYIGISEKERVFKKIDE